MTDNINLKDSVYIGSNQRSLFKESSPSLCSADKSGDRKNNQTTLKYNWMCF